MIFQHILVLILLLVQMNTNYKLNWDRPGWSKRWEGVGSDIFMNYLPFAEKTDFSFSILSTRMQYVGKFLQNS